MAGRPTKYKAEYCELLETILSGGGFAVTFCREVGIGEDTFQAWVKKHESFSKSYKKGRAAAKADFIKKIHEAAFDSEKNRVNNGLISLLAVNCYNMRTKNDRPEEKTDEKPMPVKVEIVRKSARKKKD